MSTLEATRRLIALSAERGSPRQTARSVLSTGQATLLIAILAAVGVGISLDPHATVIGLLAAAIVFWGLFVGLRLTLWAAAASYRYPAVSTARLSRRGLPRYTLLVPLYREANMVASLVEALDQLTYPRQKLEVLLLLEADDEETRAAVGALALPSHYKVVEIPPGGPKTKPNALNVGLARATGKLCVIYDAEDRPEPDQLLKAVACFRVSPPDVVCLQARLAFWNGNSSWVTRFYWAEYVVHFEWVLAGAARLNLIPPLGGTSNHFITDALRRVAIQRELLPFQENYLGAWDPYNVTEDAELAGAFARHGYRVSMLDSTTWEEATAQLRQADKQRRRWLKGYAQTGLVYTRSPLRTIRQVGFMRWFFFNLLMLGTPISLLLTPVFWGVLAVYVATRATAIESLFPTPIYYPGMTLMVIGNLLLFDQLIAGCLKRGGYGSVKYMLLAPMWWLFTSWSAFAMLGELIFRPHHWHKTHHGHDLAKDELELAVDTR